MQHFDIVIVGGGVVGSATAYYLKKQGFRGSVAIIERDTTYGYSCTARSAGGLRQQFSTPENIALSLFGLSLIRNLEKEFGAGADVGFREQGYLILASGEGVRVLEQNHRIQTANGADNILLDAKGLKETFPWMETDGLVLGCFGRSGEGWLDPYSLMTLLRKGAVALGATVIAGEVSGISIAGERVESVTLATGESISCGILVNAAGAGAGALARLAGIELPVGPRKRYVYVLDCPAATEELHKAPLSVDPSGIWFRPEGSHFITGLSPEEHDEPPDLDWEVDYNWFEERIWPGLAQRVPQFEAIKVINAWVGHYDYNALDQNAVIGAHPRIRNFCFGNGFSGHGLQQGPGVGNALAELIIHGGFKTNDFTCFGYERIAEGRPLFEQNVI
ncbi:MAG: FAD-binding oxidoreductase [Rhizobiales bacterium]|nr:FAD-binding oxidoreductase [Hyphomicrobiales bacterium]